MNPSVLAVTDALSSTPEKIFFALLLSYFPLVIYLSIRRQNNWVKPIRTGKTPSQKEFIFASTATWMLLWPVIAFFSFWVLFGLALNAWGDSDNPIYDVLALLVLVGALLVFALAWTFSTRFNKVLLQRYQKRPATNKR